jgi:hypothetical protein
MTRTEEPQPITHADATDIEVAKVLADAIRKALTRFNLAEIGVVLAGELRGMGMLIADHPDPAFHPAAEKYRTASVGVRAAMETLWRRNGI